MAATTLERYVGALVGLHVGNWAGAFRQVFSLPPGQPTHDAEHAAIVAENIIRWGYLNQGELRYHFFSLVNGGKSVFTDGPVYHVPEDMPHYLCLLRSVPLALYYGALERVNEREVRDLANFGGVNDPLAEDGALLLVATLASLLEGRDAEDARTWVRHRIHYAVAEEAEAATLQAPVPASAASYLQANYALGVALHALACSTSFEVGLAKSIAASGETGAYGALAGALLGARFGFDAIPSDLRRLMKGREKMEELALELYKLAHPKAFRRV